MKEYPVLEKCKHCGSEARIFKDHPDPGLAMFYASCSNPGCGITVGAQTMELLIEKWNRRID